MTTLNGTWDQPWDGGLTTLSSGEDQTNNVLVTEEGRFGFFRKSGTGNSKFASAPGDYLARVIVDVQTLAGTLTIQDGGRVLCILPIGTVAPFVLEVGLTCDTDWQITTSNSGDRASVVGRFTP